MPATHKGGCYCGAVEIEMRGEPLETGYCHCELPALFHGAGERVHIVEKRKCEPHQGRRVSR